MKCKSCGHENDPCAKFCGNCGTQCYENQTISSEASNGKKRTQEVKMLIAIAVAVVVLLVALIAKSASNPVVDLNQYVEIEVSGVDGYGYAEANFDYDSFFEDYQGKIEYSKSSEMSDWLKSAYESPVSAFFDNCFIGTLSENRNLSNGDSVEFVWSIDTELEDAFKVKIKYKDFRVKIENLKEVQEIDIAPYLTIKTDGYDGYGNASVSFDRAKFTVDYQDVIEYNPTYFWVGSFVENYRSAAHCLAQQYINGIHLSKNSGLKNGDIITVSYSFDDDVLLEAFGVRLQCSVVNHKLEDLQKIETVDLFNYITVTFSGVEGNGKVNVDIDRSVDFMKSVMVDISDDYNLVNGSKVTLKIEDHYLFIDNVTYFAEEFGVKPVGYEKEYTVSGLMEYASSVKQISENAMEQMKTRTEGMIEENVASWGSKRTCKGKEYVGTLLLKHKDIKNIFGESKNQIYVIYKITVNDGELFDYYFATRFSNAYCKEDGTLAVDIGTAYRGNAFFLKWTNTEMLTYYGYKTWDDLISKLLPGDGSNYGYDATFDIT